MLRVLSALTLMPALAVRVALSARIRLTMSLTVTRSEIVTVPWTMYHVVSFSPHVVVVLPTSATVTPVGVVFESYEPVAVLYPR